MDWIYHLNDIGQVAVQFWASQEGNKVFAFHGEMGVGKTSFIHALCDAKGVKDVVGSPSFSLVNEYETAEGDTIFHMDLYRIKDEEEASRAGIEDCLYSGHICLVEWPEKIPGLLPLETVPVYLRWIDNDRRSIIIGDK
jgi:tRNA threonylcarbamoyladenosine biosynthesis protein TsaE